ncbi:MAG: aldo/keto reductase, partial [Thermoleophilia bacterium]|nr:aldo/keto reductase [Thermoleophilia bacterium]
MVRKYARLAGPGFEIVFSRPRNLHKGDGPSLRLQLGWSTPTAGATVRRMTTISAAASGTFSIGGDLPVTRLGFGAMRITGAGIWGDPPDRSRALALLRRLPELGVDFIDT